MAKFNNIKGKSFKQIKLDFNYIRRKFFPLTNLQLIFVLPAIWLCFLAITLIFKPELLYLVFAALLILLALAFIVVSYLVIAIERKANQLMKKLQGGLVIQSAPVIISEERIKQEIVDQIKAKKVVFH